MLLFSQNGATCVGTPYFDTPVCICTPQWTGDLCDYPGNSKDMKYNTELLYVNFSITLKFRKFHFHNNYE